MSSMECYVEARAPVNIAVIKYWGKSDEALKIPLNDSLSVTLNMDDMCTTTSVQVSEKLEKDVLFLNGEEQEMSEESPAAKMLHHIRSISPLVRGKSSTVKTKITTYNNFPTAAGLASSAAGYACLAYALGQAYGVTDIQTLSKIARNGSGSACRSLFGGFVHWVKGYNHDTSLAYQVADQNHWPEMRVIICVINDNKKDVSSSLGMSNSVKTSSLIKHRVEKVVPERIDAMKEAILKKDFDSYAEITMRDSDQFHAICLDTFPPIFYLNETSKQIIRMCHLINSFTGTKRVAYTFDAGPNACIYLLENFVAEFIQILNFYFANAEKEESLQVKGRNVRPHTSNKSNPALDHLKRSKLQHMTGTIKYLISSSLGSGPTLLEQKEY